MVLGSQNYYAPCYYYKYDYLSFIASATTYYCFIICTIATSGSTEYYY